MTSLVPFDALANILAEREKAITERNELLAARRVDLNAKRAELDRRDAVIRELTEAREALRVEGEQVAHRCRLVAVEAGEGAERFTHLKSEEDSVRTRIRERKGLLMKIEFDTEQQRPLVCSDNEADVVGGLERLRAERDQGQQRCVMVHKLLTELQSEGERQVLAVRDETARQMEEANGMRREQERRKSEILRATRELQGICEEEIGRLGAPLLPASRPAEAAEQAALEKRCMALQGEVEALDAAVRDQRSRLPAEPLRISHDVPEPPQLLTLRALAQTQRREIAICQRDRERLHARVAEIEHAEAAARNESAGRDLGDAVQAEEERLKQKFSRREERQAKLQQAIEAQQQSMTERLTAQRGRNETISAQVAKIVAESRKRQKIAAAARDELKRLGLELDAVELEIRNLQAEAPVMLPQIPVVTPSPTDDATKPAGRRAGPPAPARVAPTRNSESRIGDMRRDLSQVEARVEQAEQRVIQLKEEEKRVHGQIADLRRRNAELQKNVAEYGDVATHHRAVVQAPAPVAPPQRRRPR